MTLAMTLQCSPCAAYIERMMLVSSRPVSATKASISARPSSLSSSLSAASPWMTRTPGIFSLISWQRAALLSMTVMCMRLSRKSRMR